MRTTDTRSLRPITTLAVACLLLSGLVVAPAGVQAQGLEELHVSLPPTVRPQAFGTSVFIGVPGPDPVQVLSGYASGAYTDSGGNAILASEDSIVLHRGGIYQIHLEGVLFHDVDDPSGDPDASAAFVILVDGSPEVLCLTPSRTAAPDVPSLIAPSPDHERAAACNAVFTVEVHGDGAAGEYPRDAEVQAALLPNDRPLGDATLALFRMEVTRIGK